MDTLSVFAVGFSVFIATTLFVLYAFFMPHAHKTWIALGSGAGILGGLALAQYYHFRFFSGDIDPLETSGYRFLILFMPSMFYFFSRCILFPERKTEPAQLLHFLPWILGPFASREVAVPLAFSVGASYCFWLTGIAYRLRHVRTRFGLVSSFLTFFTLIAIVVLVLGFAVSSIDSAYFYYFYSNAIAASLVLVTATLIVFPNVLQEINEVVRLGYANTTLGRIDVDACKEKLQSLMDEAKIYQNENLSLSVLAEAMDLSPHQLSELINTEYEQSFSQFIRMKRVEAAKTLLVSEENASILSVSMEVGFKSQSNFYAAFKEITGDSPGNFRKSLKI